MTGIDEKNEFFRIVAEIDNVEDCKNFFEDVCTIKEIEAMSQRLLVAKMLKQGKTFNEIEEAIGASSATISRVNKCLVYGQGYKTIL